MSTTVLTPAQVPPQPADFGRLIDLLAVLGEANRMLDEMQRDIERGYLDIVSTKRQSYATIQATISEAEAAIGVIVARNPSWFAEKKNVTTPYGSVKTKSSTELVVPNEEAAIVLIRAAKRKELLRVVIELNKEALQELKDDELAQFGLSRKTKENLTIDTEVVDLGKAVKAAEKSEAAANKTAKKSAKLTGADQ